MTGAAGLFPEVQVERQQASAGTERSERGSTGPVFGRGRRYSLTSSGDGDETRPGGSEGSRLPAVTLVKCAPPGQVEQRPQTTSEGERFSATGLGLPSGTSEHFSGVSAQDVPAPTRFSLSKVNSSHLPTACKQLTSQE